MSDDEPDYEANESYATEFINRDGDDDVDAFQFAFICPRCDHQNNLKGDPRKFGKPFGCLECNWVSLLVQEYLEEFAAEHYTESEEFQVQVWATSEFLPRIDDVDSEADAREEARETVKREAGVMDDNIQSVSVTRAGDETWNGEVWAKKEYVERVTATSPDGAETAAVKQAKASHGLVDSDIDSVHIEGRREVTA